MVQTYKDFKICVEVLRKVKVRGREASLKVNSYNKTTVRRENDVGIAREQ